MSETYIAPLTRAEWRELLAIMQYARYAPPEPRHERRVRDMMATQDPRARDMPWEDLRRFALTVIGGYALLKFAEGPGA